MHPRPLSRRPKTHSSASRSANTTPATSGRSLQSHASLDRATDHRGEGMGVTMTSMPELAGSQWVTSDARAVHAVLAGKGPRQGDASRPRAAGTREADVAQVWDDAVAESTRGAEGVRAKWLEDIRRRGTCCEAPPQPDCPCTRREHAPGIRPPTMHRARLAGRGWRSPAGRGS